MGAVEAYMPFWNKEREARVRDFQEEVGISQIDEKEQIMWQTNNGTQRVV